ncbi:hypothetical protein [Myceligenerans crystallogenes]|uniref:Uncharacterized protein n=1 Tax=Myceligenerans crystallogenes TaxID=316335 RepID=A0ABN2NAL0_9MICO
MSITTTETAMAGAAGAPLSLVELLVDVAAVVGRIGEGKVAAVDMGRGVVVLTLVGGVDAFKVGDALGLDFKTVRIGRADGERAAFGRSDQTGAIPILEVRGGMYHGDLAAYGYDERSPLWYASEMERRDRAHGIAHTGRPGEQHLGCTGLVPGWETD